MPREGQIHLEETGLGDGEAAVPRLVTGVDDRISVLIGTPRDDVRAAREIPDGRSEPLALVVSGDPEACGPLREGVARYGFQAASAPDLDTAVQLLAQLRPDVVLVDTAAGRLDAGAACAAVHAQLLAADAPVVVLATPPEIDGLARAPETGAASLVAKPITPRALAYMLRCAIRREEAAHHPADFDRTTALPNQRVFRRRLERALERAEGERRYVATLVLELDESGISEYLDPAERELLLGQVAERLSGSVRASDVVAGGAGPATPRGGEQFSVLLDDLDDLEVVAVVARRITSELARPFRLSDRDVMVGLALGVAVYPRDGAYAERLLERAHSSMSPAHDDASGVVRTDAQDDLNRLALASRLRDAIERDVLVLHYQPRFDTATDEVVGLEALVRWHDGERLVPPDEFMLLAEETGLVVPLGEWVLRTACTQAVAWQRAGLASVRLSVNVSRRQLRQPGFASVVGRILEETRLAADWLQLELTEPTMGDADGTVAALTALRAVGVRVAVRTGYSPMAHFRRLPVTGLKIDRALVSSVAARPDGAAIVRGIVTLGRTLGLEVVAEGVERPEQLELLQREGCRIAQGYLLARPCPSDDVTTLLTSVVPAERTDKVVMEPVMEARVS